MFLIHRSIKQNLKHWYTYYLILSLKLLTKTCITAEVASSGFFLLFMSNSTVHEHLSIKISLPQTNGQWKKLVKSWIIAKPMCTNALSPLSVVVALVTDGANKHRRYCWVLFIVDNHLGHLGHLGHLVGDCGVSTRSHCFYF